MCKIEPNSNCSHESWRWSKAYYLDGIALRSSINQGIVQSVVEISNMVYTPKLIRNSLIRQIRMFISAHQFMQIAQSSFNLCQKNLKIAQSASRDQETTTLTHDRSGLEETVALPR